MEIVSTYEKSFKRSLIDDIKSKISGNVKSVFINLLTPIPEFYCRQLRKTRHDGIVGDVAIAVFTFSTDFHEYLNGDMGDDEILIQIMCTMSNADIRKVCATYQAMFGKRLEQGIREEKTGNFRKLLKILAAGKRDETPTIDANAAKTDALALQKNFKKSIPSEKSVIEVLCTKSFAQIKLISEEYKKLGGASLEKAVKYNFSDSLKEALVAIIRTANNPLNFYARRINKAINNFLHYDHCLGQLIVARCEVDLLDIKHEFLRTFRKTIKSSLKKEISGSYKYALLVLLGDD